MDMRVNIIEKLDKDLREASKTLTQQSVRLMVDTYYQKQKDRIRSAQRRDALEENKAVEVMSWFTNQDEKIENGIKVMLDCWSLNHPVGSWLRSIHGIGPVTAAGLLAYLDIKKAPTVGHFWSLAGLDPTQKWEKGCKRPWSQQLKRLCYIIGDFGIAAHAKSEESFYGEIFRKRREYEWAKNLKGDYADQCAARFEQLSKLPKGKRTDSVKKMLKWYGGKYRSAVKDNETGAWSGIGFIEDETIKVGIPMLPPGHINMRSKRYAVKMLLSHLHEVWFEIEFKKKPPLFYALQVLEHVHYVPPPNWKTDVREWVKRENRADSVIVDPRASV